MRYNVVLDLHGVVFHSIRRDVMRAGFAKLNPFVAAWIFICYLLKVNERAIEKHLSQVIYDCACRAVPIDGALRAVDEMTSMPNIRVNVCSAVIFPSMAKMLETHYRTLDDGLMRVSRYYLVTPFNNKSVALSNMDAVDFNDGGKNYFVDDTPRNLEYAHLLGWQPILITRDAHDAYFAAKKYGARSFTDLAEFARYIMRQH